MKKFKRRSARMNRMHFRVLVRRYFKQIFTSLGTFLPLLLQAPVMLAIVYIVCVKDAFIHKTAEYLTSANVVLFVLVVMCALMGILNSYREICKERDVLSREVFGGLDIPAYVLSKFTVLSAIGIVQCAILFFGTLPAIDFAFPNPATGYLCAYGAMALTNISTMAIGLFISALLKKSESAILPVLFIIIEQVVFCDCLFTLEGGAGWLRYITPSAWGIAVFGNAAGLNDWAPPLFHKDLFALNPLIGLGVMAAITLLFVFLTTLRLKRAYRQKD